MGKMEIVKIMPTCWVVGRPGSNVGNGASLTFGTYQMPVVARRKMMMTLPGSIIL